ncbi:hypothetical protein CEXT_511721 [Caerostris extrusa]|uniref:Uncharacterized protein n=1 Tax=Caerostris extrusa TaxID=172846 RepID=A0AAV4VT10_CAEEX|nr:hypothetical protein CEXT_511721 [Caerostris extrusa]
MLDILNQLLNDENTTEEQRQSCEKFSDVEFKIYDRNDHLWYLKDLMKYQLKCLKYASKYAKLKKELKQYLYKTFYEAMIA